MPEQVPTSNKQGESGQKAFAPAVTRGSSNPVWVLVSSSIEKNQLDRMVSESLSGAALSPRAPAKLSKEAVGLPSRGQGQLHWAGWKSVGHTPPDLKQHVPHHSTENAGPKWKPTRGPKTHSEPVLPISVPMILQTQSPKTAPSLTPAPEVCLCPNLLMRNLTHREVKFPAQGHTAVSGETRSADTDPWSWHIQQARG